MKIYLIFSFVTFTIYTFPSELKASTQITKLIPLDDWIAFKNRTSDIKPLDKFLAKIRATYDFVFHKPDNVSNIEKIFTENKSDPILYDSEKIIMSTLSLIGGIIENNKGNISNNNSIYMKLLADENVIPTKESSISRIADNNKWLDDIEALEPLSDGEVIDDENIDRSVEIVKPTPDIQFPDAVVKAFDKWLGYILHFTREAYLKLMHLSVKAQ